MSYQRSAKQKIARKDRREVDRELARIERERRARRARQRRIALRAGVVVGVLAVLAGAGLVVNARIEAGRRGPANMISDGLVLSSDGTTTNALPTDPLPDNGTPTPTVDLSASGFTQAVAYLDYADPASAAFWAANGTLLENWLTSSGGHASLELHPVALSAGRESYSPAPAPSSSAAPTPNPQDAGHDYAVRAANAFACVAASRPDSALAVNDALFAAQSQFGSAGLSDDELVQLVADAGVTGVDGCIRGHRYTRWVERASDRAALTVPFDGVDAVSSTPLVVIGGQQYTGAPEDSTSFLGFLLQVSEEISAAASSDTPTPTPTPSAPATAGPSPTGTPSA